MRKVLVREGDAVKAGDLLVELRSTGRIYVGVGGTSSTDGGTGMARSLGYRFLDARGKDLPPGEIGDIYLRSESYGGSLYVGEAPKLPRPVSISPEAPKPNPPRS